MKNLSNINEFGKSTVRPSIADNSGFVFVLFLLSWVKTYRQEFLMENKSSKRVKRVFFNDSVGETLQFISTVTKNLLS